MRKPIAQVWIHERKKEIFFGSLVCLGVCVVWWMWVVKWRVCVCVYGRVRVRVYVCVCEREKANIHTNKMNADGALLGLHSNNKNGSFCVCCVYISCLIGKPFTSAGCIALLFCFTSMILSAC